MLGFHLFSQGGTEPLSIGISPSSLTTNGGNGNLTSAPAVGLAVGGKAPFSYAWTYSSGDAHTVNTPGSASTTFTSNGTNEFRRGVYKCTVTDDNMDTADKTIQVNFRHGTPM